MRERFGIYIAIVLLGSWFPTALRAELLSQALHTFPAGTRSFEYDNLAKLRSLPDYATLRAEYSGPSLDRVKTVFSQLGITEQSIQEILTGTGSTGSYGLVSGNFGAVRSGGRIPKPGLHSMLIQTERAQCSNAGVCVLFLDDSVAVFGRASDLLAMLQARRGAAPSLNTNAPISTLLSKADLTAPVIGLAPGSQLSTWIGDSIPKSLLSDSSRILSSIRLFQFSVKFDQKAHLTANLECVSSVAAVSLRESLAAISALHSLVANFSDGASSTQFENLTASSNENFVRLGLDVSIK